VFRLDRIRGSRNERRPEGLLIVVSRVDPRAATTVLVRKQSGGGQSSMTANDQHQPASSRAIATLATVDRLRRARNPTHRLCKRRLPW